MENFRKRTVLVTGGSRGIGREIVNAFAENAYNVAFCYNKDDKSAQGLLSELLAREVNAIVVKCDVSDFNAVKKMRETLKSHYGFIDTIINNAAIEHRSIFTLDTEKDFDAVINTNLKSVFNICSHFVPDMVNERFGRIINISSIWGVLGASMEVLYSMSKAGVIGFTKALAKELAPSNITVNSIAPGYIETDMNVNISTSDKDEFLKTVPMGRTASTNEVTSSALFFADKNSAYITGQILGVNGGMI